MMPIDQALRLAQRCAVTKTGKLIIPQGVTMTVLIHAIHALAKDHIVRASRAVLT